MGRGKHKIQRENISFRILPELKAWLKEKERPNAYLEALLQSQKNLEEQTLK